MKYQRKLDIVGVSLDQDLVMMDDQTGSCFGLNPVAKTIWQLLETPLSQDELVADLIDRYDVDLETCHAEVECFLQKLTEYNLVSPV